MITYVLAAAVALTAPSQTVSGAGPSGTVVAVPAVPFPSGHTQTINILEWDTNQLPRVYERSHQLPLTDEELQKLVEAGFDTATVVKMIEERRCACDASAEGLIRLKKAGAAKEIIAAVSLHGLAPNRSLLLDVTLDFTGLGSQAREAFLYVFVEDGDITRVMTVNIADLLGRKNAHETNVDQSDILIPRQVRRIRLPGQVPLKTYGKRTILVATSGSPSLTHPSELTPAERKNSQTYTFDYPRASLTSLCRLTAGYWRDPVLAHRWNFTGSRFECEWN